MHRGWMDGCEDAPKQAMDVMELATESKRWKDLWKRLVRGRQL